MGEELKSTTGWSDREDLGERWGQWVEKRVRRTNVGSVGQFFQDAHLGGQELEKSLRGNRGQRKKGRFWVLFLRMREIDPEFETPS